APGGPAGRGDLPAAADARRARRTLPAVRARGADPGGAEGDGRRPARMNEAQFLKRSRPEWARIEAFAARLDGKGQPLSGTELFTLVSLYRKITGDLARARMLKMHPEVVDYLNQLVGRVHFLVYAPPPYPLRKVLGFFRRGFPQAVRRQWRYVLGALLLLLIPAV